MNIIRLIAILSFFFGCGVSLSAQKEMPEKDPSEMTKAENILTPLVSPKQHQVVVDYMRREAQALVKLGYKVETERKGEVIVVTIPASELFAPNETKLLKNAFEKLEPFLSYLKAEDRFKILVAMHSDDTGSQEYKEQLTTLRLDEVVELMSKNARYPGQLIGYAIADDEPLKPNKNRVNRAINRRLEIYIIPSTSLIQQLKKK